MGRHPSRSPQRRALLWGVHILVLRGIKEAAALNTIATFAKMVPILLFIVVVIFAFKADVFALNFWGGEEPTFANVSNQVRNTMLVTVFVFVGIEGASVYSRYAKDRNDVGIATVLGFLGVLALLVLVTMLSYGILLRPELRALATPSMAACWRRSLDHGARSSSASAFSFRSSATTCPGRCSPLRCSTPPP